MTDRKIVDYITIVDIQPKIDERVIEFIKKGYQPYYSPFVLYSDNEPNVVCQAIVKYEDIDNV